MPDEITIRCFGNLEDSYGYCVLVDQLLSEGLGEVRAHAIAQQWIQAPRCDKGE